ncbi:cytochrome b/b6 domain-containing protein [Celeribacter marinus]|uniref:cytochrome b/b6 domain-containing protein n=1 Tax=Celeribacter marinus TaxID=1397108 RepID=UPI003CCC7D85
MFHWGLVAAFAAAYLSAEELSTVHEVAGYIVAGLVAFRLIWGFAGSRYARFAQFMKGPSATVRYLGDMVSGRERRYLGHNPAGAAMIVALLITLSGTAFTGWLMEDETRMAMLPDFPQIVAPAWADDDGDERAEHGEGGESALGVQSSRPSAVWAIGWVSREASAQPAGPAGPVGRSRTDGAVAVGCNRHRRNCPGRLNILPRSILYVLIDAMSAASLMCRQTNDRANSASPIFIASSILACSDHMVSRRLLFMMYISL